MSLLRLSCILLGLTLCACSSWQQRADDLQADLEASVAAGLTDKDGFVKRYGAPKACAAEAEAESCEWILRLSDLTSIDKTPASGTLKAEFDKSGGLVRGQVSIRHGLQEFLGRAEPRDAAFREAQHKKALSRTVDDSQGWFDRVWKH
ncbi:MAG: hypothetical protein HY926_06250 [Elusimicrobia bacterium]|nr:hypothetical protein [Elusimicrobiota bacterium]